MIGCSPLCPMKKLIIFDFNRTLFDPDAGKLFDSALEVLRALKDSGARLFLIGKGMKERENLIYDLGLDRFFEKIILKEEKEIGDFEMIRKLAEEGDELFSVGDRIKKEITLSNLCGFKTIWFQNGKFSTEVPESEMEKPWKTIEALGELMGILA